MKTDREIMRELLLTSGNEGKSKTKDGLAITLKRCDGGILELLFDNRGNPSSENKVQELLGFCEGYAILGKIDSLPQGKRTYLIRRS